LGHKVKKIERIRSQIQDAAEVNDFETCIELENEINKLQVRGRDTSISRFKSFFVGVDSIVGLKLTYR